MRLLWPLALVVALTGCAAADPATEPPTPTISATSPSTSRAPSPSPTPTEEPAPAPSGPPEQCLNHGIRDTLTDEAMTEAASNADLPETAVLMHVQTITSIDEPGMTEAVARVCSEPMTEDELIDIATAIAVAIKPSKASDDLAVLVVSAWQPDGDSIAQGETVRSDYQLFTWEPGSPTASNWE